ncbi:MAG: small ribosomal subunit biogenesis GTPase RsgA [Gammaproteobacteria bacterium]|nr:small ribosomal subunit biogenesis GTPase RsgA [Gammaproteobacteria bacterium]
MSKRKLSKKQEWRAQKIQDERIQRAEKKLKKLQTGDEASESTSHNGFVVASFGTQFIVEDDHKQRFKSLARQNLGAIVVGDKIVFETFEHGDAVITAVLARDSLLERPNFNGNTKPVAANIDQILVMSSILPTLATVLIDRYLVAIELSEIDPIIVINKIDLLNPDELKTLKDSLSYYEDIGYNIIFVATKSREGLSMIEHILHDKVSILVGQSGVGKSSTIKALLPDIEIQIGELSTISKLGKHTTSASQWYHLAASGAIIDSPGVRDFGLWHLEKENVAWGFREFRPYLGTCKYSNCSHINEPECSIIDAVDNKKIPTERWGNYIKIYLSLKE